MTSIFAFAYRILLCCSVPREALFVGSVQAQERVQTKQVNHVLQSKNEEQQDKKCLSFENISLPLRANCRQALSMALALRPTQQTKKVPCNFIRSSTTKLFLLVIAHTPRMERFMWELENEDALMFAVKGLAKPSPVSLDNHSPA